MKPIIFFPVHEDLLSFSAAINYLYASTNAEFDLLIIESGSKDGCAEYCDLLPKLYPNKSIEIMHTPKVGALKAYNQAFEIAKQRKQDIYMTQTDVIHYRHYGKDWLQELINCVERSRGKIGCIVAANGFGICINGYIEGMPWAGFWSIYIPYNTIEKIGGFDENYLIGDAVDIDWTYRMNLEQLPLVIANWTPINYVVDHHHLTAHVGETAQSHEELEKIKAKNRIYFAKKFKLEVNKDDIRRAETGR